MAAVIIRPYEDTEEMTIRRQKHAGKMPFGDGGGEWSDVSTSQRMPRTAGRGTDGFSPRAFGEKTGPAEPRLGLLAPRPGREQTSVVLSPPVCGNLLWWPQCPSG